MGDLDILCEHIVQRREKESVGDLDVLCECLLQLKNEEADCRQHRIEIERQILKAIPDEKKKLEGSSTIKTNQYKVKVTSKLSYKLDYEAYQDLNLPPCDRFVSLKPSLDLKRYRRIDDYISSQCVTVKPQKTAITIEEVE